MNQKNIFTIIAVVLLLQGIFFYVMGDKVIADSFPNLDDKGIYAGTVLMQVISVISLIVGMITYAVRNTANAVWAYLIGFILFSGLSLKHLLVDHINVPIPAIVIQLGIVLACAYLWMQNRKAIA